MSTYSHRATSRLYRILISKSDRVKTGKARSEQDREIDSRQRGRSATIAWYFRLFASWGK